MTINIHQLLSITIKQESCSKNMYNSIMKYIAKYIEKEIMTAFKGSDEFSEYARTTYYVQPDGTPLEDEGEEEEEGKEEGKKKKWRQRGKEIFCEPQIQKWFWNKFLHL